MKKFLWPLNRNNITNQDKKILSKFVLNTDIFTQSKKVYEFEKKWSEWLGVKYSVFVNSGASANLLSIHALKILNKTKKNEIIVPALTWSSDLVSVINCGFKPVFVDINLKNLSMNVEEVKKKISKKTLAIFISHIMGFNGLDDELLKICKTKNIKLIEDVCESHGASFKNKKLGTYGFMSNFSFYYAHHMTTIEGGMICTSNSKIYEILKVIRSHGLISGKNGENNNTSKYPYTQRQFVFKYQGFNLRNNEISALLGIQQLKLLNKNIKIRNYNKILFLKNLNSKIFFVDFDLDGMSNYGLNLVLKNKNKKLFNKVCELLYSNGIEFRIGSAGGGNQLRHPYMKDYSGNYSSFVNADHVHYYGLYIGNNPFITKKQVLNLCSMLNKLNP